MSDAVRTMAAGFFRRKNREAAVLQFSSGKELLDYDKPVDILFLDIRMKGLDGMETARKLRYQCKKKRSGHNNPVNKNSLQTPLKIKEAIHYE